MKKNYIKITLAILIILACVVIVIVYTNYQNEKGSTYNFDSSDEIKNSATPNPPIINEEPGWKTFRNEKYGFQFSYPSNLEVTQVGEAGTNWQIETGDSTVLFGLNQKGEVNCNYANAAEDFKNVYAFWKSSNPSRYIVQTNKDYDFELLGACMTNTCASGDEWELQAEILKTFRVLGDVESLNCAG